MKAKTTEDMGISVMRRNNNRFRGVNPGTAELIYKSQRRFQAKDFGKNLLLFDPVGANE